MRVEGLVVLTSFFALKIRSYNFKSYEHGLVHRILENKKTLVNTRVNADGGT